MLFSVLKCAQVAMLSADDIAHKLGIDSRTIVVTQVDGNSSSTARQMVIEISGDASLETGFVRSSLTLLMGSLAMSFSISRASGAQRYHLACIVQIAFTTGPGI